MTLSEKGFTIGRPSLFNPEMADKVLNLLMEGKSLRDIQKIDGMPHMATICRWLAEHESFREQYALARLVQAHSEFDELLEIVDDSTNDYMDKQRPNGTVYRALDAENVNRSKLRAEIRLKRIALLAPKVYSEVQRKEVTNNTPELTDEQLAAQLLRLAQKARERGMLPSDLGSLPIDNVAIDPPAQAIDVQGGTLDSGDGPHE